MTLINRLPNHVRTEMKQFNADIDKLIREASISLNIHRMEGTISPSQRGAAELLIKHYIHVALERHLQ